MLLLRGDRGFQILRKQQGYAVLARMAGAMPEIVGAFTVSVLNLVVPQTVFRTYQIVAFVQHLDGTKED